MLYQNVEWTEKREARIPELEARVAELESHIASALRWAELGGLRVAVVHLKRAPKDIEGGEVDGEQA